MEGDEIWTIFFLSLSGSEKGWALGRWPCRRVRIDGKRWIARRVKSERCCCCCCRSDVHRSFGITNRFLCNGGISSDNPHHSQRSETHRLPFHTIKNLTILTSLLWEEHWRHHHRDKTVWLRILILAHPACPDGAHPLLGSVWNPYESNIQYSWLVGSELVILCYRSV